MNSKKTLKELMKQDGIIVAPGCFDVLTARIVESLGFPALYYGGYANGSSTGITEPLTTMTEMLNDASNIANRCNLPLIVDGDAGWGDATHTWRTVKEFIRGGISAIHIEDQWYPKRAHYHIDVTYVMPREEALAKLRAAIKARGDSDFLIIARTDAREAVKGSLEEAIERGNLYAEAGADLIMPYTTTPPDPKEAALMVKEIKAPLLYISSEGMNRPKLNVREIEQMGYKIVIFNITATFITVKAINDVFTTLKNTGQTGLSYEDMLPYRQLTDKLSGLPELISIEKDYGMEKI